jgi:hypothetical protein
MNFTTWLKKEEGFTSKAQYNLLLNALPAEGRRKVRLYYKEKYKYYVSTKPEQLDFKIK